MKNKVIRLFVCIFVFATLFTSLLSNRKVQATSKFDDFKDFSFVIYPDFKMGDIIWTVDVTWTTSKEIKYLDVIIQLEDGHEESTYQTGRDNMSKLIVTEIDDTINYRLVFNVNSTEKLQIIKFVITYSYIDEIDPSPNNINVKTYFLSPGNTRYPEKIKIWSFLLIGVIVSICAGIATFIIIQNTKTAFFKVGNGVENYDEEDESY